jgi:catechol 2,3-dioxygenase-like lactoylglutathione lyase family enzyme
VIHHVALETRRADAGESERFWELLGFARVVPPPSLAERAVWLEHGGTQIHLMYADDPVAPPRGHTAVVATDYAASVERVRAAGYAVDVRPEHWGSPRCFVAAPGGHRVELMAFPPGAGA